MLHPYSTIRASTKDIVESMAEISFKDEAENARNDKDRTSSLAGQRCRYMPPGNHGRNSSRIGTSTECLMNEELSVRSPDMATAGISRTGFNDKVTCLEAQQDTDRRNLPNCKTDQHRHLAEIFHCVNANRPDMTSVMSRMETFHTPWRHQSTRASITEIAEAGLFYIGQSDSTTCFYCNGGIQNWDYNDDPWIEHAKWFPDCPFVLSKKGIKFVLEVTIDHLDLTRPTIPNSSGLISLPHDTTSSHSPTSTQVATALSRNKISEVLQSMGYSMDDVKRANARWEHNHNQCQIVDLVRKLLNSPAKHETPSTNRNRDLAPGIEQFRYQDGTRKQKGTTESDSFPIVHSNPSDAETEPVIYVHVPNPSEEKSRLASFIKCLPQFHPSMRHAARDGLYFTGNGDAALCFCCGKTWHILQGAYTRNLHENDCGMMDPHIATGNTPTEGLGEVQELIRQGQTIRQPTATPGQREEPQDEPPANKRRRSNSKDRGRPNERGHHPQ